MSNPVWIVARTGGAPPYPIILCVQPGQNVFVPAHRRDLLNHIYREMRKHSLLLDALVFSSDDGYEHMLNIYNYVHDEMSA